jgi:hypothetical protein
MSTTPAPPTPAHRWATRAALRSSVAALAVLALVVPATTAADAATAPAVPKAPTFTVPVDLKPEYQGQQFCAPTPRPGTVALGKLIAATYPAYPTIGFERDCSVGGQSEHKDGRALDWMVSVRVADQKATADAFLKWLLATGPDGTPNAMARRLGVMYIGWNDQIWRGYGKTGWSELFDCQTNPDKKATAYDNTCHRNHIHISLSWDGAAGMTSFYDGTPVLAPTCTPPSTTPTAPAAAGLQLVPVAPVTVLDTAKGVGTGAPCRVSGISWTGQKRAVAFKVTGVGDVPATGVAAVLLRLYPVRSNVASTLRVWTTGTAAPTSAAASPVYDGRSTTSTYVVPVASDGTVRVSTRYGGTDVIAQVLAYSPVAGAISATASGGNVRVTAPTRIATVTVPAGSQVSVPVSGRAGVASSPSNVTGVQLRVSATSAAGTRGNLRVGGVSATGATVLPPRFTLIYVGGQIRSSAATVATSNGSVVLRNDGTVPATVSLDVLGWYGRATSTGGLRFVPRSPSLVVDTTTAVELPTTLAAATTAQASFTPTQVPDGTKGLVLQVETFGRGGTGGLTVRPTGATTTGRSADVLASTWTSDVVVVPLGAERTLEMLTTDAGADVRAWVVGYLR